MATITFTEQQLTWHHAYTKVQLNKLKIQYHGNTL